MHCKQRRLILTLPTASPTNPLLSICKLRRKFPPSSGEDGWEVKSTCSLWAARVDAPSEVTSRKDSDGVQDGLLADRRLCADDALLVKLFTIALASTFAGRLLDVRAGKLNGSFLVDECDDDRDMNKLTTVRG
jgi:hypothetical protein